MLNVLLGGTSAVSVSYRLASEWSFQGNISQMLEEKRHLWQSPQGMSQASFEDFNFFK